MLSASTDDGRPIIDTALVRRLIVTQFPAWAELPIEPVRHRGWDNRTFHLGSERAVRLPSGARYAAQIEKEQRWLPVLAPMLPLPIPELLGQGAPCAEFPFAWSVYRWIEGETAETASAAGVEALAVDLAGFLAALRRIDACGGPAPGSHNFFRGGSLGVYDDQARRALAILDGRIDARTATAAWDAAIASDWRHSPVWLHGDVAAGNILVKNGRLCAVIDFGNLGVGDPACDLAIAWTFFDDKSRAAFRSALQVDDDTWARGWGWALWKALIVLAELPGTDSRQQPTSRRVLDAVLANFDA